MVKADDNNSERLLGMAAVMLTSFLWGTTGTVATFAQDVSPRLLLVLLLWALVGSCKQLSRYVL